MHNFSLRMSVVTSCLAHCTPYTALCIESRCQRRDRAVSLAQCICKMLGNCGSIFSRRPFLHLWLESLRLMT